MRTVTGLELNVIAAMHFSMTNASCKHRGTAAVGDGAALTGTDFQLCVKCVRHAFTSR
jgi:hypothetical protein